MTRRSRVTYLCGGVFDDLRLIGQSLLLQGKRTVSWGPRGGRCQGGDLPGQMSGPPLGFLSPIPQGFIHYKRKSPSDRADRQPREQRGSVSPVLTGAARALPARQRRKKIQALIFQQTLNKREEKEG